MEWIKLNLQVIRSEEYIGCEPVQRATYINLLAYCVDQETMGVIKDCKSWNDRKWMQICGVMKSEVEECPLFWFEGEALKVFAYPEKEQLSCESKRQKCKDAQLKRWEKERSRSPSKSPNTGPNTEKSRVEESRVDTEGMDLSTQEQAQVEIPKVDPAFFTAGYERLKTLSIRSPDYGLWTKRMTEYNEVFKAATDKLHEELQKRHRAKDQYAPRWLDLGPIVEECEEMIVAQKLKAQEEQEAAAEQPLPTPTTTDLGELEELF